MQTSIERGNERVETQRALNYEKKKRKRKILRTISSKVASS